MQKKINYILSFKIIYLIHVLLAFNCFLFRIKLLDYTSIVIMIMGGILLINRIRNAREYISYKFLGILLLLLLSYGISTFFNWEYGVIGNIKGGVWMTFQFLLLYLLEPGKGKEERKKEVKIIATVFIIYTSVCSLLGVIMTFYAYGGRMNFDDGTGTFYGFVWGRLWGCYTDPNHGAIVTAVAIFLAIYLLESMKTKCMRILLIGSIVFNYLYLVFSDSRSAKVSFTLGSMILIYLTLKVKFKISDLKNRMLHILSTLLLALCVYASFGVVKDIYNYCVTEVEKTENIEELEQKEEEGKSQSIGREKDIEGDYSNRRFDIWKSGVEIFEENKIVGVGFRNITSYANQEMPDTYIVNNDYGDFDSFHNLVIDVLVSQGGLGIILVFVLGISVFIYAVKKMIFENKYLSLECRILFVIVFILAVDSMFISAIFYVNSPETVLFWMMLGYLVWFLNEREGCKQCTN